MVNIRVRSAGYSDGNTAAFFMNGQRIDVATRIGLNVVVLRSDTLFGAFRTFDTHGPNGSAPLVSFLQGLDAGTLVLLAARDDARSGLTTAARSAVELCGGQAIWNLTYRASYALIGIKGGPSYAEVMAHEHGGMAEATYQYLVPSPSTTSPPDGAAVRIRVISEGYNENNTGAKFGTAEFYLDDQRQFIPSGRGMNVVALFPDGSYNASYVFDTHGSTGAPLLVAFVESLPQGTPVLIAVRDDAKPGLTDEAKDAIKDLGATLIDSLRYRSAYALVGVKGGEKLAEMVLPEGQGAIQLTARFVHGVTTTVTATPEPTSTTTVTPAPPPPPCSDFACPAGSALKLAAGFLRGGNATVCCDAVAEDRLSVVVKSAGWDDGRLAEFYLKGSRISVSTKRGMNVVVLRPDGSVIRSGERRPQTFDTGARGSFAAADLTAFLDGLENGTVVLLAAKDDARAGLSLEAKDAIARCGSTRIHSLGWREGYALVGVKGGAAFAEHVSPRFAGPAVAVARLVAAPSAGAASKPVCPARASNPPVSGWVANHQLELEAGCRYELWEGQNAASCLEGSWMVVVGGSNTVLMALQLASMLAPEAIAPVRDGATMGGFTVVDVIVRDGAVVYRSAQKLAECTALPHDASCKAGIASVVAQAPPHSRGFGGTRITLFEARFWDHADAALEALIADPGWTSAPLGMLVQVSTWYIYCAAMKLSWCPRTDLKDPALTHAQGLSLFSSHLAPVVSKLEALCVQGGRAEKHGCWVATTSWQKPAASRVRFYEDYNAAIVSALDGKTSEILRIIDLWTLGQAFPDENILGHGSPALNLWNWQVMLGGMCASEDAAEGTFAEFEGALCFGPSAQRVKVRTNPDKYDLTPETGSRCPSYWSACPGKGGSHLRCEPWECANSEPCKLTAVLKDQVEANLTGACFDEIRCNFDNSQALDIRVLSAGPSDGDSATFYVNRLPLNVTTGAGMNVVVLRTEGSVDVVRTFDTHSSSGSEALAAFLNALSVGAPVLVAARGESADGLAGSAAARAALEGCGALEIANHTHAGSYALVGVKGGAGLAEARQPAGTGAAEAGALYLVSASTAEAEASCRRVWCDEGLQFVPALVAGLLVACLWFGSHLFTRFAPKRLRHLIEGEAAGKVARKAESRPVEAKPVAAPAPAEPAVDPHPAAAAPVEEDQPPEQLHEAVGGPALLLGLRDLSSERSKKSTASRASKATRASKSPGVAPSADGAAVAAHGDAAATAAAPPAAEPRESADVAPEQPASGAGKTPAGAVALDVKEAKEADRPAAAESRPPTADAVATGKAAAKKPQGAGDKFPLGLARMCASLHVVLGHLHAKGGVVPDVYFFGWGFTWVPWFFMLSGFVLFTAHLRRPKDEGVFEYVMRRSVTIYPLYAVSLVPAFAIRKSLGNAPSALVLVAQSWLLQAWAPTWTERALQMHCWFLSAMVVYWFLFKPLSRCLQGISLRSTVALMAVLFFLPWLVVVVPALLDQNFTWYKEHKGTATGTWLDLAVVALKFHPACYLHVFVLGMLLARLRLLLDVKAVAAGSPRRWRWPMELVAPAGYAGLCVVFAAEAVQPWGYKLSTRLSILLPFQAAVLLGLAGLPSLPRGWLASFASRFDFLENYSYAVYVFQFICYSVWPKKKDINLIYFMTFLLMTAVFVVHMVQRPVQRWWGKHPRARWGIPVVLSAALGGLEIFLPGATASNDLPAFLRHDDRMIDVRLALVDDQSDGGSIMNPSLLIKDGEVLVAARRHRLQTRRRLDDGSCLARHGAAGCIIVDQTWHSQILLGSAPLDSAAWARWPATARSPFQASLSAWTALRTPAGRRWDDLCVRETYVPENNTLIRHVVTGPEDPKLVALPTGAAAVVFDSLPPEGANGCTADRGLAPVSQLYLAQLGGGLQGDVARRLGYGAQVDNEKNWIPFLASGTRELLFAYEPVPHEIIACEAENLTCASLHSHSFRPLQRFQREHPGLAEWRGSGQAVLIEGSEQATPNLPRRHYLGLLHGVELSTKRYVHFAYRFAAEPPYNMLQVSAQLPLQGARAEGGGGPAFAFASGLAVHAGVVVISYGAGDRDARALVLTLGRLDALFTCNGGGPGNSTSGF